METRGPAIGGNDDMIRAPYAPYTNAAHSQFSLPSVLPARATPLRSTGGKSDCASFPASGASFERGKVAQAMLDVFAVLFAIAFVLVTGIGFAFAVCWFLFF